MKSRFLWIGLAFIFLSIISPAFSNEQAFPEVKNYDQLLNVIREIRQTTDSQSRKARVQEAWTIGKLIEIHSTEYKLWADYPAYLMERLTKDLKMKPNDLRLIRRFARLYPNNPPPQDLSLGHYMNIIEIADSVLRDEIATRAENEDWSRDQLREETKKIKKNMVMSDELQAPGESENLNTYSATVTQVLDGDTFDAVVNLGFGMTAIQRFRLRGLDAPELDTEKGIAAKAFLVNEMNRSQGRIIVKAARQDKYNRYLAEVWIHGEALAKKLLEHGIVIEVKES